MSGLPELRSALGLAFDLNTRAAPDDRADVGHLLHTMPLPDAAGVDLIETAAAAYQALAAEKPEFAREAERHTLDALVQHGIGGGRKQGTQPDPALTGTLRRWRA